MTEKTCFKLIFKLQFNSNLVEVKKYTLIWVEKGLIDARSTCGRFFFQKKFEIESIDIMTGEKIDKIWFLDRKSKEFK